MDNNIKKDNVKDENNKKIIDKKRRLAFKPSPNDYLWSRFDQNSGSHIRRYPLHEKEIKKNKEIE